MAETQLCPVCVGYGDAYYPIDLYGHNVEYELKPCETCFGKGFLVPRQRLRPICREEKKGGKTALDRVCDSFSKHGRDKKMGAV